MDLKICGYWNPSNLKAEIKLEISYLNNYRLIKMSQFKKYC